MRHGEIVLHLGYGWYNEDAELLAALAEMGTRALEAIPLASTNATGHVFRDGDARRGHELVQMINDEIRRAHGQAEWRRKAEQAARRKRDRAAERAARADA